MGLVMAGLFEWLKRGSSGWAADRRNELMITKVLSSEEMASDRLIANEEVLAEDLRDPVFREKWERTAVARWLAVEVAHFRAERGLSQRQLAERLGVHQSDVARMELGEHNPSVERLMRVAGGLGIELMIDIRPRGKEAKLPKKNALASTSLAFGNCEVILATAAH